MRGYVSAEAYPSSGASRHPLPQGEKGRRAARLTGKSNHIQMSGKDCIELGDKMQIRSGTLAIAILATTASNASAAPATVNGSAALALAGVVALYSPLLTADEREAVSAFFVGQTGVRYAKKISVTADKIACKVSNVDISARSCELTF